MFSASEFQALYGEMFDGLVKTVTLKVNNGTDYDTYTGVRAHVSSYQDSELVAGGSIKVGDLRLIIQADTLPGGLRDLEQKDRVEIAGRSFAFITWDPYTRSIGDQTIAVEATIRGGGLV